MAAETFCYATLNMKGLLNFCAKISHSHSQLLRLNDIGIGVIA